MVKQLSDREIEELLFKLRDKLGLKERENVRKMLKDARSGGLYEEEMRKELRRLRADFKISAGDADIIEQAIFS